MLRTLQIALCSTLLIAAACKKSDKPVDSAAAPATATSPAVAAKPGDAPTSAGSGAVTPPAATGSAAAPAAGSAAAPVPTGTNTELETKGIAMMTKMADMFATDAKDCEKLATDIKGFVAQNKDLLNQLTTMEKAQSQQEREAFAQRNKGVEESVMQKMTPAMTACRDNKNVEAAMKQFPSD